MWCVYIALQVPSNQQVLTRQYDQDAVRPLDEYKEATPPYRDWNKYKAPTTPPTDTEGIERSLSPYSTNQSVPHGSSPTPSQRDEAPPTTSSLESDGTGSSDLDLRMANL